MPSGLLGRKVRRSKPPAAATVTVAERRHSRPRSVKSEVPPRRVQDYDAAEALGGIEEDGDKEGEATASHAARAPRVSAAQVSDRGGKQGPPALLHRGVSLGFLLRFAEFVRNSVPAEQFAELTTQDLVHGKGIDPLPQDNEAIRASEPLPYSVRGLTRRQAANMVEFLQADEPDSDKLRRELQAQQLRSVSREVRVAANQSSTAWFGVADFFVSHTWSLRFQDLLEALSDPRCTGSEDIKSHYSKRFWIDIFAVNQHYLDDKEMHDKVERERSADLDGFESVVREVREGMILFLHPWNKPSVNILSRAWCWYEISLAQQHNRNINLALTRKDANELKAVTDAYLKNPNDWTAAEEAQCDVVASMLRGISVEKSVCRIREDQDFIHATIAERVSFPKANQNITLAIAGLVMTTADAMLSTLTVTGTENLYEAMLDFFPEREKAKNYNKLVRVYMAMGWKEKARQLCEKAISVQRELIGRERDNAVREALKQELASNLNSLGRLFCDRRDAKAITPALRLLDEALEIRGEEDHEVLYNIGRTIVQHWENYDSRATRHRERDLLRARRVLEKSKELQEAAGRRSGKHAGSLGACCVLLARGLDLRGDAADADRIEALFAQGIRVQQLVFGARDPRIFMTKTDFARYYMKHQHQREAWELLKEANEGLTRAVRLKGGDPVKLLECLECMVELCQSFEPLREEGGNVIASAFAFIDWLEELRPHILDADDTLQLVRRIHKMSFQHMTKLDLVLDAVANYSRPRADFDKQTQAVPDYKRAVDDAYKRMERLRSLPRGASAPAPALMCLGMEELLEAMPSCVVDVIVSDAPYNIGVNKQWDSLGHEAFVEQVDRWARLMVRCLSPDGIGFAFTDSYYLSYWVNALRTARGAPALNETSTSPAPPVLVESAVWSKPDAQWRREFIDDNADDQSFSADFRGQPQLVKHSFEVILIFRRSRSASTQFTDIADRLLAHDAANVFQISKCSGEERLQGDAWHPAQKPLRLMRALTEVCLQRSDDPRREMLVLEPFAGTASALVASAGQGVSSLGCDNDPHWVQVAQDRCERFFSEQTEPDGLRGRLTRLARTALVSPFAAPARSELRRLRDRLDEKEARIAELERELAAARRR